VAEGLSGMFRRQANVPRKGQGLAFQASMEGVTGTREEIIADQITDAMKVTVPPKRRWRRTCIRCSAALKNSVSSSKRTRSNMKLECLITCELINY
jgi:RNase P subunit RPR2